MISRIFLSLLALVVVATTSPAVYAVGGTGSNAPAPVNVPTNASGADRAPVPAPVIGDTSGTTSGNNPPVPAPVNNTSAVSDVSPLAPSQPAATGSTKPTPAAGTALDGGDTNATNPFYQNLGPKNSNPKPALPAAFTVPVYSSVESYLVSVINFILDFLGLIIISMLVYGGYQYIMAMGDSGKLKKAKGILTSAVVGFFLVVISFAIVTTIITATKPAVNECASVQGGICLSSSGQGLNFGVGTGVVRAIGSIF